MSDDIIKKDILAPTPMLYELYKKIETENLNVEKGGPDHHLRSHFAEIGFKKYFWTENSRLLSKDDPFLHDSNERQLNTFLNINKL